MRILATTGILIFLFVSAFGQVGKSNVQQDNPNIIKDIYKGALLNDGQNITTILTLQHLIYHDDGDFTLTEIYKDEKNKEQTANSLGDWTVLKGDAKDENATVVELDAPERILYFVRLKNGNLQKLDTSLREIKPAVKYILRKEGNLLSGTYTGKCPGNACWKETTLVLECGTSCTEGDYTLNTKYTGTKGAHKTSKPETRKGKWNIAAKEIAADSTKTVIVLDADKPGKSIFYLVKDDGNLLSRDKDPKQANVLLDLTLEKK